MEASPVTYRTFWVIFIQKEASMVSIVEIIHDFLFRRGLVSKTAMLFILLTMIFVFVFPTLASAMTGYTSNVAGFVVA